MHIIVTKDQAVSLLFCLRGYRDLIMASCDEPLKVKVCNLIEYVDDALFVNTEKSFH